MNPPLLSGLTTSHYIYPFSKRGKWISMLQDFNFKIVHRVGARHGNVNALNRNPVGSHDEDEDFGVEIQDENKNVNVA
jgi:hypothetical protein